MALGNADPGAGLREGGEGGDLPAADPGVDEHRHGANLQQGQHRHVEVDRHRDHDDRPVPGPEPQTPQPGGGAADAVPEAAEGDGARLQDQRRPVRNAPGDLVEDGEDVVGSHDNGSSYSRYSRVTRPWPPSRSPEGFPSL